jgi:hypothetical protein
MSVEDGEFRVCLSELEVDRLITQALAAEYLDGGVGWLTKVWHDADLTFFAARKVDDD